MSKFPRYKHLVEERPKIQTKDTQTLPTLTKQSKVIDKEEDFGGKLEEREVNKESANESTKEHTKESTNENTKEIHVKNFQEVNLNKLQENSKTNSENIKKSEDFIKAKLRAMVDDRLKDAPSLLPYRKHPLFHFLKNRNTIDQNQVLRFRDLKNPKPITTLILKPVARAIAGNDGKAMATPLSRAVLRKGSNVDILFEPEAVAIAGPGGIAHAQSDLEIFYDDEA